MWNIHSSSERTICCPTPVIARAIAHRPVLSPSRNRAHDHARIDFAKYLVTQSVSFEHAGTIVLRNHVGMLRQFTNDLDARRRFQVETDTLLPAIMLDI